MIEIGRMYAGNGAKVFVACKGIQACPRIKLSTNTAIFRDDYHSSTRVKKTLLKALFPYNFQMQSSLLFYFLTSVFNSLISPLFAAFTNLLKCSIDISAFFPILSIRLTVCVCSSRTNFGHGLPACLVHQWGLVHYAHAKGYMNDETYKKEMARIKVLRG